MILVPWGFAAVYSSGWSFLGFNMVSTWVFFILKWFQNIRGKQLLILIKIKWYTVINNP